MQHFYNNEDPQKIKIDGLFKNFTEKTKKENAVIVVESGLRGVAKTEEDSLEHEGGEGGYITYLTHIKNISCVCYEPSKETVLKSATTIYGPPNVFYVSMMDAISQYSRELPKISNEEFVNYFIKEFNILLETNFNIDDLKNIHREFFGEKVSLFDGEHAYNIANPFSESNRFKDLQQFRMKERDVEVLHHFILNYNARVHQFSLYGSSHVKLYYYIFNKYEKELFQNFN